MKIGFRATSGMPTYRLSAHTVTEDGKTYDFKKDEAERLMQDFPLNWFKADAHADQLAKEAEEATVKAEAAKTALPSGHPEAAGDITGVDLGSLTSEAEINTYKEAARKTDAGAELNDVELEIFERVEIANADTTDAGEGSKEGDDSDKVKE